MANFPYDHIPAGKKPVKDDKTGEWTLVDLDVNDSNDRLQILDDVLAANRELETQISKLRALVNRLSADDRIKNLLEEIDSLKEQLAFVDGSKGKKKAA